MKNNIIFIGYMGCGKSTVGCKMAEMLSMPFLDTDQWIEEKEGITISEMFAIKGEAYFRDLETECLKELLQKDGLLVPEETTGPVEDCIGKRGQVISVGGGLPVREENQKLLKQLGKVIYLKAKPDTIYERLKGDTTRPLLQTEDPLQKIKDMLAVRDQKYLAAAHWVIEVDEKSIMEIIHEIIADDGSNLGL